MQVCGLKWSPDDRELASGGNDNQLYIWGVNTTSPVIKFSDHLAAVKALAWSPHQHGLIASGGGTADRCIRFWNTATASPLSCVDTGWRRNSFYLKTFYIVPHSNPLMNSIDTAPLPLQAYAIFMVQNKHTTKFLHGVTSLLRVMPALVKWLMRLGRCKLASFRNTAMQRRLTIE